MKELHFDMIILYDDETGERIASVGASFDEPIEFGEKDELVITFSKEGMAVVQLNNDDTLH